MDKKSQIHIEETIAILLVFFALLILGFAFYSTIMKGIFGKEKEESRQLEAIAVAQKVPFLPELQCSENNIIASDCIDIYKLDAAREVIKKNPIFYIGEFGMSTITVNEIYPDSKKWVIYNNTLPDSVKLSTDIPIALKDPTKINKYHFGILSVDVYLK